MEKKIIVKLYTSKTEASKAFQHDYLKKKDISGVKQWVYQLENKNYSYYYRSLNEFLNKRDKFLANQKIWKIDISAVINYLEGQTQILTYN